MAQEKARPTRARTTKKEAAAKSAAKPTRKRAPVKAPGPPHEAIATAAYHLWERGEPGDPTAHWLRAEQELAA